MKGHDEGSHAEVESHITSNTIFGFWVYLMTDAILFSTLFAAYAVLHTHTHGGPGAKELFHIPYALTETFVLLASSFTCGLAMLAVSKENLAKTVGWYGITFILGLIFLFLVGNEFYRLAEEGQVWQRNGFLSAYFTLIGTHALHIAFGLLFIVVFLMQLKSRGFVPAVIRRLTCLKIFWFFSYFIWIFMFAIVYLIGVS